MSALSLPSSRPLILASTSQYRKQLLARLRLPFETRAPETDETPLPGEAPGELALRLAAAKARAVARHHAAAPGALVIGSDQVAHCEGRIMGKPGNYENAVAQLRAMRGKTTIFDTALCLIDAASGREQIRLLPTRVTLRMLDDAEIDAYLRAEEPYDCAGSAKSEGLGISLMQSMEGEDPNALIGLPLIALCAMLRAEGLRIPSSP
ncbi:MAG TPA: Maf family nucleotide pyrophosphatase [Burkholderiales bacterium]|nr:Maf family nucleotide pyrophosphatase [Burkholderiales bacterium]